MYDKEAVKEELEKAKYLAQTEEVDELEQKLKEYLHLIRAEDNKPGGKYELSFVWDPLVVEVRPLKGLDEGFRVYQRDTRYDLRKLCSELQESKLDVDQIGDHLLKEKLRNEGRRRHGKS